MNQPLVCKRCGSIGRYDYHWAKGVARSVRIICRKCGNTGGWANSDPTAVLLWQRFNESGVPERLGRLDKDGKPK